MRLIWLLPLIPAAGAAVNGLAGVRWFGRAAAGAVACLAMLSAFAVALTASIALIRLPPEARAYDVTLGPWLPPIPLATAHGIGSFAAEWAFRLDPLATVMILVVTGIGLLIHVYATAYMMDEPRGGYARFFCYLNLFCAFMLAEQSMMRM